MHVVGSVQSTTVQHSSKQRWVDRTSETTFQIWRPMWSKIAKYKFVCITTPYKYQLGENNECALNCPRIYYQLTLYYLFIHRLLVRITGPDKFYHKLLKKIVEITNILKENGGCEDAKNAKMFLRVILKCSKLKNFQTRQIRCFRYTKRLYGKYVVILHVFKNHYGTLDRSGWYLRQVKLNLKPAT